MRRAERRVALGVQVQLHRQPRRDRVLAQADDGRHQPIDHLRARRRRLGQQRLDAGDRLLHVLVQQRQQQVVLAGKAGIERALRKPGPLEDAADRRLRHTALGDDVGRGSQKTLPSLLQPFGAGLARGRHGGPLVTWRQRVCHEPPARQRAVIRAREVSISSDINLGNRSRPGCVAPRPHRLRQAPRRAMKETASRRGARAGSRGRAGRAGQRHAAGARLAQPPPGGRDLLHPVRAALWRPYRQAVGRARVRQCPRADRRGHARPVAVGHRTRGGQAVRDQPVSFDLRVR